MDIPEHLKYTNEHEWVSVDGNQAIVGITSYAQGELGDIVYVELPEVGEEVEQHKPFGSIEAVKAVSDLFSPVSGKVVEINEQLADKPELVNSDPYGEGWMIKIEMSNPAEVDKLLSAEDYRQLVA